MWIFAAPWPPRSERERASPNKALPTLVRFPALMSGEVDILARNTTWALGREVRLGIVFTGPLVYSSQGVLVRAESGMADIAALDNTKICVVKDSTQDASLLYWAMRMKLHIDKVGFDSDVQAREAFLRGECQGYASDVVLLASMRLGAPGGKDAYGIIEDDSAAILLAKGYLVMAKVVPELALGFGYTAWPPASLPIFAGMMFGGTLGGNVTLIGSSATLVAVGISASYGKPVPFVAFMRYGIPIAGCQLAVSALYVWLLSLFVGH